MKSTRARKRSHRPHAPKVPGVQRGREAGRTPGAGAAAILLTGTFAVASVPVYAGGALPVPCPGSSRCSGIAFDPLNTKSTLAAGISQLVNTGSSLTINQGSAATAIYNWASFNISPGNTVDFVQASTSAVALNRIYDPNVSTISGNLQSNGQIYLVNPNGILFGKGANVNVGGLIASTLDISNSRIVFGLLSDTNPSDPVFSSNASVTGSPLQASTGANPSIVVQDGATLYAAGRNQSGTIVSAGRIFLFAPTVENAGSISVDGGGQVILAAGSNVYLGSSQDPSLRGLLVEVNGTSNGVTIDPTGNITVSHGNITLMGMAVSQDGTLIATSALDANGSIRLIAREANPSLTSQGDPSVLLGAAETGSVTLGSGSKTEVVLDPNDTATAPLDDPAASTLKSTIEIEGLTVSIGGNGAPGSTIVAAQGGDITVTARAASSANAVQGNPTAYQIGTAGNLLGADDPNATINVGPDAVINASGLQNVPINGALYFTYIDPLTSSNLANAPYQRGGFLLGQGVYVNLLQAPSWLDVSNLLDAVAATQAQRNTVGGTVGLYAEGSVNLAPGSVVNVSGGSTNISAATGRLSELVQANGSIVSIDSASATAQYVGFADGGSYAISDPLEGINTTVSWQAPFYAQVGGYTAGANAGTIQIYAPQASIGGTLLAQTTSTPQQRSAPPAGGLLQIGSATVLSNLDSEAGISRASIVLTTDPAAADSLVQGDQSGAPIVLDTTDLQSEGFTRLNLTSDGVVELAANSPLNLGPSGQLTIAANAVSINSSITAPGGTVSIQERPLTGLPGGDTSYTDEYQQREQLNRITDPAIRGLVDFAPGTSVSTAGLWTNDEFPPSSAMPSSPIVLNGGRISISGRTVDVSETSFDVSAGADLSVNGTFTGGSGGSLSLSGTYQTPSGQVNIDNGVLELGTNFASRIQGYGFVNGGTLDLYSPTLTLGGTQASNGSSLVVPTSIGNSGFQAFGLSAYNSASLAPGVTFAPSVPTLQYSVSVVVAPTAAQLPAGILLEPALPGQTNPATIGLSASNAIAGTVQIGAGSAIGAGIEGSIALNAGSRIEIEGTLSAPAGNVSATLGAAPVSILTLAQINQRAIVLDPGAAIDVSGADLISLTPSGLSVGSVLPGGNVVLSAQTGTVALEAGSSILAHGTTGAVDIASISGQYQLQTAASAGGVVDVVGGNGIAVEGFIDAHGGNTTVGGGALSLALQDTDIASLGIGGAAGAQLTGRQTLYVTNALPALAADNPASSFAATADQGYVSPATLNGSGFANVWLQSPDVIQLGSSAAKASAQTLGVPASIVLAAPAIAVAPGWSFTVQSPYLAVGPAELLSTETAVNGYTPNAALAASAGSGGLTLAGQGVDIVGSVSLAGVGLALIEATGDVRALGTTNTTTASPRVTASLQFGGNLTIDAARLYPATQTDFTISGPTSQAGAGVLVITSEGAAPTSVPVLSAGGTLTIAAGDVDIQGQVLAPLGSIGIDASRTLTLESGSLLSVAGNALVPYGSVVNGTTWTYGVPPDNSNAAIGPYTIASVDGFTVPSKAISLSARTVTTQSGSTINVSGGGDVQGVQFIAGPGGSYDMSQNFPYSVATTTTVIASTGAASAVTTTTATTQRNPYFALVPSVGKSFSAFDPQVFSDLVLNPGLPGLSYAAFQIGETITIGAGSALPAGTYTIMPPRYALLPGAFAVEAMSGYQDLQPGQSALLPDGTTVVAGLLGDAAAGIQASRWSGYRVYTNSQFNTLSQFQTFIGSTFVDAIAAGLDLPTPRTGGDAGILQIAGSAMLLDGTIEAQHASGTQGADVAIDAPSIVVANSAPANGSPQSTVTLSAAQLDAVGAQTLVLGALDSRSAPTSSSGSGGGTTVTLDTPIASQTVSVDATTPLSAGEIILAAQNVTVAGLAQVRATGSVLAPTDTLIAQGNGALLYVANSSQSPQYTRTGASASGTATTGDLTVGNAQISGQSLILDATRSQTYATAASLSAGSIDFSAALVNVGAVPAGTPGIDLTPQLLATLDGAHSLVVTTLGGIDAYGSATLGQLGAGGQPLTASLTLVGPGIAGFGSGSDALQINAGHVALENPFGYSLFLAGTGSGRLTLSSSAAGGGDGSIALSQSVSVQGFQNVALDAVGTQSGGVTAYGTGDVLFAGTVGSSAALDVLGSTANLEISATRVTAQSGVNAAISVPGSVQILASGPATTPEQQNLGASLQVTASDITVSGRIDLPAGVIDLQAANGITLGSGALLRAAGAAQPFASTTADAAAGTVSLVSTTGSIIEAGGAMIDVSAAGTSGDAGNLNLLAAQGTVTLDGGLALAQAGQGRGAQVTIDAGSLSNANALVAAIGSGAGSGTLDSVSLRARTGNIVVGGGGSQTTLAGNSITLEADGGNGPTDGSIDVYGSLVASGSAGGQVSLYANNQVVLESGGLLDVHAAGAGQSAGSVLISARINGEQGAPTTLDGIVLQSGSTVNLQGGAGGSAGSILLESSVAASGSDVEIAPIASSVIQGTGAAKVVDVVFADNVQNGQITSALMSQAATQLRNFMTPADVSAITARLGFSTSDPTFNLRPALELISSSDMTVDAPIDFSAGLQSVSTGAGSFQWRYGGSTLATSQPGELILRAGGTLSIEDNISDGFLNQPTSAGNPDTIWRSGNSWSYVLTGGADLTAANPNATVFGAGSLVIGNGSEPGVIVRTGTGSIALNAGTNVVLNNGYGQQDNVAYTAGVNDVSAPAFPAFWYTNQYGNYVPLRPVLTQGGGNLTIAAQGDVLGTAANGSNQVGSQQSVNEWLFRYGLGTNAAPNVWWTDFDSFQQGFGALGGGNLSIAAGGDVVRVGAVVPTSGYAMGSVAVVQNSGSLTVTAGGNIVQGLYYDEGGTGQIRATSLQGNPVEVQQQAGLAYNYVRFAQGDNALNVVVREGAQIQLPFNPTFSTSSALFYGSGTGNMQGPNMFATYGPQSSFSIASAAGDIDLLPAQFGSSVTLGSNGATDVTTNNFAVVPTSVQVIAFAGSIVGPSATSNEITQFPGANGQLRLLSQNGILQLDWVMSQAAPQTLPSMGSPMQVESTLALDLYTPAASATPLHAADPTQAEIVARDGSIVGVTFDIPKTTEIEAGVNIGPFADIEIQNSNQNSLSSLSAGGQFAMTSGTPFDQIYVGGQGAAQVYSGSGMNLGTDGGGIVSIGNLDNPNLPAQGATLIVAAGTGTAQTAYGPVAAAPNYLSAIRNFVQYDAFASTGSGSAALDAQVLAALSGDLSDDPSLSGIVAVLTTGLANRSGALQPGSAFQQQLAQLSPAEIAIGAMKLAAAIQIVANQQFVASSNSDTFAPAYAVFSDLFPNLTPSAAVVKQFILDNPFSASSDAAAMQASALQGLPADFVAAVELGLQSPSTVGEANSPYAQALAAIPTAILQSDVRALLASVLAVAGASRNQLSAAGELTGSGSPYAKGLTALASSFSSQTPAGYDDLDMDYNEIKAEQTGSVAILVPQGSVIVGQSSPPVLDSIAAAKVPAELGIFTLGGGDIIGMARDDFDVYRSRVFTVAGGNITLWSSDGNIDAGRGPRDVTVASPPVLAVDPSTGVEYLDFSASVTGSGIGALETEANQPVSNINLMAPAGYIDAGEAGIRAQTGKVVLGTNLVLNANNIQAASGVSGGAVVATPPPPPPPATNTSQSDRVAEEMQREVMAQQLGAAERSAAEMHVRVSGEFIGFEKDCTDSQGNEVDCKAAKKREAD